MNKPNIIVFMTDQQNASTINRDSQAVTPNMDKFLEESVQFTEAFCPSPHCCPSRATFFSGLYPTQHGVWNNVEVDNTLSRGLYDDIQLLPEYMKADGYQTIFAGKWHVSAYEGPKDRGFNKVLTEYISNYGRMSPSNIPKYNDWDKLYTPENQSKMDKINSTKEWGRIVRPGYTEFYQYGINQNPYGDTTTVELACQEIESYDDNRPLFLYIGTTGPHDPYTPPQEFLDLYDIKDIKLPDNFDDDMLDKPALYRRTKAVFNLSIDEHKESLRRYLAFVSYEDYLFGKVLESIDKKGIRENTIIIYLTDHGDYMGAHGLWAKGLPCFREAYNICVAISGRDFQKNKQNSSLVSLADLTPTILDIVGITPNKPFQGKSLVKVLSGEQEELDRTEMYTQTNGNEIYGIQRSVWNEKWKYTYNSFDFDELYNLETDPYEKTNVISDPENKEVIKQMCKKMWQFAYDTKDNCTCDYIMVALAPYGPNIIFTE